MSDTPDEATCISFIRDSAEYMNRRFGQLFVVPKPVKRQHAFFGKDQGLRIRDLQSPEKKMSKSDESGKGVIYLDESPAAAVKKIMSATTDSLASIPGELDYERQPGISNMLQMLALLQNKSITAVLREYSGQTQYGPLKMALAQAVTEFLQQYQGRLAAVDDDRLFNKISDDEKTMNEIANSTLANVHEAVGLR